MARSVLAAVQQLLDAQEQAVRQTGNVIVADTSDASIAQLHSKVIPAARILAPVDVDATSLPPEVTPHHRELLAQYSFATITWLTLGLDKGTITGKTVTKQACELLCALSDVLYPAYMVVPPSATTGHAPSSSSSSSTTQRRRGTDFTQLSRAGNIVEALSKAVKELNRHVFQGPAPADQQQQRLFKSACLTCWRITVLLDSLWRDTNPADDPRNLLHNSKLLDEYIGGGVVTQLSQATLLVLGLDPAPWVARGPHGLKQLCEAVVMGLDVARKLQAVMLRSTQHYEKVGLHATSLPLPREALQSTGPDGTTPPPFLRLNLVMLAIGQYFKRAATLPPGSVRNQPQGSPQAVQAVQRALQQQLTPSCCAQLLQRLAPSCWLVLTTQQLSPGDREIAIYGSSDADNLCASKVAASMWAISDMCRGYVGCQKSTCGLGPQEMQLLLECAEVYQILDGMSSFTRHWSHLTLALAACPYPALVEFNTRHGRTLLTLAERSLEAGMAAGGDGGNSSSGGRGTQGAARTQAQHVEVAAQVFTCLTRCLDGGPRAKVSSAGAGSYEAKGYPADATWALLDADTAPRLLRLMEALVRTPGGASQNWDSLRAVPTHLPEMELIYSNPFTARATLSAVISKTKWLRARTLALQLLLDHAAGGAAAAVTAAAAGVRKAVPGAAGAEVTDYLANPLSLLLHVMQPAAQLADIAVQGLVRSAALLDPVTFEHAAASAAAAVAAAPAGRRSRAWFREKALLDVQPGTLSASFFEDGDLALTVAPYKAQVLSNPQLLALILEQLQQGLGAHQHAAAARQAAKWAKKQGGDVAALTEQLQAVQVGASSSSSSSRSGGGGTNSHPAGTDTLLQGALMAEADSSSANIASSAAGVVPPVTPGDITVAANALLVASKAAGALLGVPQLLEQVLKLVRTVPGLSSPSEAAHIPTWTERVRVLSAAVEEVAEWAVLLHPLLVQLLPAEQGQVLVDLRSRLGCGGGRRGSIKKLSAEEVAAVLGAMQHVVIPGQPGCSNPRCCCLEGVSEADVKTQVCAGCRGVRYCSAACQKAHWKAGHKEVCKAAQAAAKAVVEAAGSASRP